MIKITRAIKESRRRDIPRKCFLLHVGKKQIHLSRKETTRIYFQLSKFFPLGRIK